ncbi:Spo0A-P phosphatase [Bacillus coahuilensis m2-6]|uniref:aspartyl-phosphate phosphatase Spo0E family protein n=1 Tax=Bacillus coahuilensis TaxID=408580 RepID=UPI0007504DC1|nr:aspartyl-phosphate phosphatase Spo0E family protein [Bacillus coahuilensis]KUP08385.1 Spo0A-P phosphatase [Bacillus coahuilensis m2-6]
MTKLILLDKIESKRKELLSIVAEQGLTSLAAIEVSQELDQLLNEYNKLYLSKKLSPTT